MIGGVFLGSLIMFFVPGVFKSFFFGREFLVNAMTCDIAVDSVPDTSGQVEAITLRPVEAAKLGSLERPFSLPSLERPFRPWMSESSLLEFRRNPSWQLRHGIYNHPNSVDEIVRWLRRVT